MNLTDFLLARYDAEGAAAPHVPVGYQWRHSGESDWQDGAVPSGVMVQVRPAAAEPDPRVLADLAAKRRIVETCGLIAGDPTLPSTHLAGRVLADLALPYADHPDYREEWRP